MKPSDTLRDGSFLSKERENRLGLLKGCNFQLNICHYVSTNLACFLINQIKYQQFVFSLYTLLKVYQFYMQIVEAIPIMLFIFEFKSSKVRERVTSFCVIIKLQR